MRRSRIELAALTTLLVIVTTTGAYAAGDLTPTNAPAPTMHSLDEIYQKIDSSSSAEPITIPDVSIHGTSTGVDVFIQGASQGDIPGSSTIVGREEAILALDIQHTVEIPTDTHTGLPTGSRIHYPLTITKYRDKATPRLHRALCTGEQLTVRVNFYQTNMTGSEVHYFTVLIQNAICVEAKTLSPSTESYSFLYEVITWTYEPDGIEEQDDWRAPVGAPPSESGE